ncbi:transposase [Methylobacterium nonmethylotrophicum]|uniref:Transposase n=1 Tax=Methylobacterium nonmethylotrophicum TaxID=1141884 RepID=A0A4Z0NMF5_9HYPH|nr:transposase [Methylobacterium nonmethylotrophicum]
MSLSLGIVRERRRADIDGWSEKAGASLLGSFAARLVKDKSAVVAALTEPWSNRQTEIQITRLKLAKSQMFGRRSLDLLEARLFGAI